MNYYLQNSACSTCGYISQRLHIGKSSCGWPFLFQAHKDTNPSITSYADIEFYVLKLNYIITNEDHDMLSLCDFKKIVDSNQISKVLDHPMDYYTDKHTYLWTFEDFS